MIKLNGVPVIPTIFPDGTSQVWHLGLGARECEADVQEFEWIFESEAEFLHLAQLKMLMDSGPFRSHLYLPYLPYARQDKFVHNDNAFALHTFAQLLNTLNFDRITVVDPHSDVAKHVIKHLSIDDARF